MTPELIEKAREAGADLAGVARVEDLKKSPSHAISEKIADFGTVGTKSVEGRKKGQVDWPAGARSAIVVAVEHPPEKPELDWWVLGTRSTAGNTPGNRILMGIVDRLATWLETEKSIRCFRLPYHIELGAIYMKDTAVLAGLGCIGKNNLVVTPQFGPRQRFRVMLVDAELPPTGPLANFDPCRGCAMPCRSACPAGAFSATMFTRQQYGQECLPGRTGVYNRLLCGGIMERSAREYEPVAGDGGKGPGKMARFCRQCELACPVGCDVRTPASGQRHIATETLCGQAVSRPR